MVPKTMHPETLSNLAREVEKARHKHPSNECLFEALCEEVCELINAQTDGLPLHEIQHEALQVACVAIRIVEEGSSIEAEWLCRRLAMYESAIRDFLRSRGTPD